MSVSTNVRNVTSTINRQERTKSRDWIGWLFALPHFLLFFVFLLVPTVYGFFISLHQWHVLAKVHPFVGLSNYKAALTDDLFWLAFRNTVYFTLLVVPAGNIISLLLALGLSKLRSNDTIFKVSFYLPTIISIAVVAVLWKWLYNTEVGLFNIYLMKAVDGLAHIGIHIPFDNIPWLSDPHWSMPSIAIMTIWWGAGGNMILYLAGLKNIPNEYYEAAKLDGATEWRQFWSITWPLLRRMTLFCLVFSILGAFQVFGQSYVLYAGGSGPGRSALTLVLYLYQQGFSQYQIGYGTAIAYLLFAIVSILTVGQFLLFKHGNKA